MLLHSSLYVLRPRLQECLRETLVAIVNDAHKKVKGEEAPNNCEGMTHSELVELFHSLKCLKCGRSDWGFYMNKHVCCSNGCC